MGTIKHLLRRCALMTLLLWTGMLAAGARQPPIVLTEGKYLHGVYPGSSIGNEDDFTCAMLDAYVGSVGRPVAWVYFSNNWFTQEMAVFPWSKVCDIHRLGAVPFIRLMLRPDTEKIKKDGDAPYSSKKIQRYFANLEFQQLTTAVNNPVSGEIRRDAAAAGIKLRDTLSQVTVDDVESNVGRLLVDYWSGGPLSVRDILRTSKTLVIGGDGNESFIYHNPFLTPFRERERAKQSKRKGAGFDSGPFKSTVSGLKALAAYNGIFEYHKIVGEAFKPHIDLSE